MDNIHVSISRKTWFFKLFKLISWYFFTSEMFFLLEKTLCEWSLINFINDDPFNYLSNGIDLVKSNKNDILDQNVQWILIKWDI
jgi:hypothetical protein